jgi:hypothetical protein
MSGCPPTSGPVSPGPSILIRTRILGPLAAFALACGGSGGGGPSGGSGEEDPGLVAGSSGGACIPLPIRDPDVGLPPDIGTRAPGTIDPDPDPELTRDPDFVLPPDVETRDPVTLRPDLDPIKGLPYCK